MSFITFLNTLLGVAFACGILKELYKPSEHEFQEQSIIALGLALLFVSVLNIINHIG